MKNLINKEIAKAKSNKIVVISNQNTAGIFEAFTAFKIGNKIKVGSQRKEFKSLKNAEKWANKILN